MNIKTAAYSYFMLCLRGKRNVLLCSGFKEASTICQDIQRAQMSEINLILPLCIKAKCICFDAFRKFGDQ